ncbi:exonuclease domain-containing protein [Methylobacterium sp. J-076]|uniref:exonuclease domain-containing protein n=1 Tax=Methylobacterium sp. J-076 TaxID=2836655 RepID=UPI001FB8BF8C|nr:exonuclease domain-containing protein [Methylobacterium sp. J-076]MCJ2015581.1 hypothetical protein [Methylobacterium sp. J-076]
MTEAATALHPADDLAFVRHELASCVSRQRLLSIREEALTTGLVADREARVGALHHAVVTRVRGRDVVDVERLPDLQRVLLLLQGPVVVADTETTGLHVLEGDRLISAAFLRIHPDAVSETLLEITVNPGRASDAAALAVHGLTEADLRDRAPFSYSHARAIIDVCRGGTIVAHNAPFDVGFLDAEFEREGLYFTGVPSDVVDTRIVSKLLWPGESGSLDALATRLGVDRGGRDVRHTAAGDARVLAACLPGIRDALRRWIAR